MKSKPRLATFLIGAGLAFSVAAFAPSAFAQGAGGAGGGFGGAAAAGGVSVGPAAPGAAGPYGPGTIPTAPSGAFAGGVGSETNPFINTPTAGPVTPTTPLEGAAQQTSPAPSRRHANANAVNSSGNGGTGQDRAAAGGANAQ